jgi:hypothetical protein
MSENCDTTRAFEAKGREANAVVRRSSARNRRINLHDRKYVIVFRRCGGVFTSDVRHILDPLAGFRIDDAK